TSSLSGVIGGPAPRCMYASALSFQARHQVRATTLVSVVSGVMTYLPTAIMSSSNSRADAWRAGTISANASLAATHAAAPAAAHAAANAAAPAAAPTASPAAAASFRAASIVGCADLARAAS